ncbi:MAG: SnoaL-like domain-containing protein, partial [Acidimicrobiia bacterium]|nr:SnoaL-like domain-containing protein [Acidimicrobiia bacterium]
MRSSLIDSVGRALEALNVEELVAHYAPRFRFEDSGAGLDIVDREELRRYYEALFSMPGVAFRVVGMFEGEGGRGAGEWVWSGLGPG